MIDTGVPLSHDRWRRSDGSTRILAAWQQMARDGDASTPFGRVFLKCELDALLEENIGGDLAGDLDEDAFNRATGVVDFAHPIGSREAAGRYSHGAHVLDAAAGVEPSGESEFREKTMIIAVNLPGSAVFGESGAYLDGLMLHAVRWVCEMADAIWLKTKRKTEPHWTFEDNRHQRSGFPIAINLSFGKQARPKTALDSFGEALKVLLDSREAERKRRTDIVMPAGNDTVVLPWMI